MSLAPAAAAPAARLRVGIDVSGAVAPDTGIGRHTVELVRALQRTCADLDLVLFLNRFPRLRPSDRSLGPVVNPRWPARVLLGAWRRLEWPPVDAFTGPVDVFHTSDWTHPPQRAGKTVVPVHDLGALVHPEWYAPEVAAIHAEKNRLAAERATAIVAVSAFTRSEILRVVGVAPERVHVVPAGVGADFAAPPEAAVAAARRRAGLTGPYLLYVGTRERRKNLGGLLDVFAVIARARPALDLAVVGMRPWAEARGIHGSEHWSGPEIEEKVARLGLSERVRFVGQVPRADLPALYAGAAAFVFPSYYEGFGLPLLEAMACGTPVVTSNRAAMPEVVGDAAVQVDPDRHREFAEAVLAVLADRHRHEDLRARGLRRAAHFTWDASARAQRDVYRAICG
ncbi:MAG TPA: glycosyltransferase family 1 protein [Vicinamibacteria bacterium]